MIDESSITGKQMEMFSEGTENELFDSLAEDEVVLEWIHPLEKRETYKMRNTLKPILIYFYRFFCENRKRIIRTENGFFYRYGP
jgi:vacuolar-type H+-ATPase subunit C/Vma6